MSAMLGAGGLESHEQFSAVKGKGEDGVRGQQGWVGLGGLDSEL